MKVRIGIIMTLVCVMVSGCFIEETGDEEKEMADNQVDRVIDDVEEEKKEVKKQVSSQSPLKEYYADVIRLDSFDDIAESNDLVSIVAIGESDDSIFFQGYQHSFSNPSQILKSNIAFEQVTILKDELPPGIVDFEYIQESTEYGHPIIRGRAAEGYHIYDLNMNEVEFYPISQFVQAQSGHNWDMTEDFGQLVYETDDTGIELMNMSSGAVLLIEASTVNNREQDDKHYYRPRFVSGGRFIEYAATQMRIDTATDYVIYDILSGSHTRLNGAETSMIDGDLGLYTYQHEGLRATVFDFKENARFVRGLYGGFFPDFHEEGINLLMGDKVISFDILNEPHLFQSTDIETGLVLPMFELGEQGVQRKAGDYKFQSYVYHDKDYIYFYVWHFETGKLLKVKPQPIDWNQFYGLDEVGYSDEMVEILGEKFDYTASDQAPLLEQLSSEQIDQMLYRTILFIDRLNAYDYTTASALGDKDLVQNFHKWGYNIEVPEGISIMLDLQNYVDGMPNGIETPVKSDEGYSVRVWWMDGSSADIQFEIGPDSIPDVVDMTFEYSE